MRCIYHQLKCVALIAILVILLACAPFGTGTSVPTQFYVLNSLFSAEAAAGDAIADLYEVSIGVGPIRLPQHLDRPQIVTRDSQNEIQVAEFSQWGEPLRVNFTRVLAENLSILLATDHVAIFPWLKTTPIDYQLSMEVTRFDGSPGENALLRARWTIFGEDGKKLLFRKLSTFSEPTGTDDIQALLAAKSRSVEHLSREIAMAIKDLSEGKTPGQQ